MSKNNFRTTFDAISRRDLIKQYLKEFISPYIATLRWAKEFLFSDVTIENVLQQVETQSPFSAIFSFIDEMFPPIKSEPEYDTDEFFLEGENDAGIILTHGFGSNPSEVREFGELLNKKGYTVHGLRLPGHGTSPDHFSIVRFEDWYLSMKNAAKKMNKRKKNTILIGHSMGGTVSLLVSAFNKIDALVSVCAPIELHPPFYPLLPTVSHFVAEWPRTPSSLKRIRAAKVKSYHIVPLNMVVELFALMEVTRKYLDKINVPALVVAARKDKVVPFENAERIFSTIRSEKKEFWVAENSTHQVFIDKLDVSALVSKVDSFLRKNVF